MTKNKNDFSSRAQFIVYLAGGRRHVASELGISYQAVGKWVDIPADRVTVLAGMLDRTRHYINPKAYHRDIKCDCGKIYLGVKK